MHANQYIALDRLSNKFYVPFSVQMKVFISKHYLLAIKQFL